MRLHPKRLVGVAPASCRLSRELGLNPSKGSLALDAAGEDARQTAAGTAALLFRIDRATIRTSLELFAEGGELLLDFGQLPAQGANVFFQLREAVGCGWLSVP
jgi:hypothetical protein